VKAIIYCQFISKYIGNSGYTETKDSIILEP